MNIKASVIFLSWLILFSHGIIPHHHADNELHKLAHDNSLRVHDNDCSKQDELSAQHIGESACPISGILFHKFGQDESLICVAPDICRDFDLNSKKTFCETRENNVPVKFLCSILLRAPPVA